MKKYEVVFNEGHSRWEAKHFVEAATSRAAIELAIAERRRDAQSGDFGAQVDFRVYDESSEKLVFDSEADFDGDVAAYEVEEEGEEEA